MANQAAADTHKENGRRFHRRRFPPCLPPSSLPPIRKPVSSDALPSFTEFFVVSWHGIGRFACSYLLPVSEWSINWKWSSQWSCIWFFLRLNELVLVWSVPNQFCLIHAASRRKILRESGSHSSFTGILTDFLFRPCCMEVFSHR